VVSLAGPPFPAFKAHSISYSRLAFLKSLNWKFVNWWVWLSTYLLRMAAGSRFEPNNPTGQKLGTFKCSTE